MHAYSRVGFTFSAAAVAFAALTIAPTLAADTAYPTTVKSSPRVPVSLTTCRFYHNDYVLKAENNASNKTNNFLMSYVVRWTVFDHSGTMIGQSDQSFAFDTDLAPGDSIHRDEQPGDLHMSEPGSAIGHATCRLQSAKFEGGKSWTFGRIWKGKLL